MPGFCPVCSICVAFCDYIPSTSRLEILCVLVKYLTYHSHALNQSCHYQCNFMCLWSFFILFFIPSLYQTLIYSKSLIWYQQLWHKKSSVTKIIISPIPKCYACYRCGSSIFRHTVHTGVLYSSSLNFMHMCVH